MEVIQVWPGEAPGEDGSIGKETFRPPWSEESKGVKWLTNVTQPTLTVYRPEKERDTGAAILIFPGGGYWNLAWDLEGEEVADWLNSIGMTGLLLKYRVPRRKGQPEKLPAPLPLLDAQRALRLARSQAPEWGVDPQKIGTIGFSAGGHLAAAMATRFDTPAYLPMDPIDRVSCRPDFAVLLYSGYLIQEETGLLASDLHISADTPPIFLAHASDDSVSRVDHSIVMYQALQRADVPAELHIYPTGGHGFGVRKSDHPVSSWLESCIDWFRKLGVLE